MKTSILYDNYGTAVEYIEKLNVGDKLYCKKTIITLFGPANGFRSEEFTKGNIYDVSHITYWDGIHRVAYVSSNTGTSYFARADVFEYHMYDKTTKD